MQCLNPECDATVKKNARICPQCGTALKPFPLSASREADRRDKETWMKLSQQGRSKKLANASVILGIFSCPLFWIAFFGVLERLHHWGLPIERLLFPLLSSLFLFLLVIVPPLGIAAIVTGHMAFTKGRRVPGTGGSPRRALVGSVLGYLNIIVPILLITFAYYNKGRPCQEMAACEGNLKQIAYMFKVYGDEHHDRFPPLSAQPGVLMFTEKEMPVLGLRARFPLTCPTIRYAKGEIGADNAYDDQSYFYLGYAVFNDNDVEAFAQAYRKQIAEGGSFEEDLVIDAGGETRVIQRLSEAVLRATSLTYTGTPYHTPSAAPNGDPPLLIERDLGHIDADTEGRPRGAHVLYLHSGVHYVHEGVWPITEKTQRILAELAE